MSASTLTAKGKTGFVRLRVLMCLSDFHPMTDMTENERQQVIQALERAANYISLQSLSGDIDAALSIMRRDAEPEPPPLTNAQLRAMVDAMPITKRNA